MIEDIDETQMIPTPPESSEESEAAQSEKESTNQIEIILDQPLRPKQPSSKHLQAEVSPKQVFRFTSVAPESPAKISSKDQNEIEGEDKPAQIDVVKLDAEEESFDLEQKFDPNRDDNVKSDPSRADSRASCKSAMMDVFEKKIQCRTHVQETNLMQGSTIQKQVLKNLNFKKIELKKPTEDADLSEQFNFKMQQKGFQRQQKRLNLINITVAKSKALMQREYSMSLKDKMKGLKLVKN